MPLPCAWLQHSAVQRKRAVFRIPQLYISSLNQISFDEETSFTDVLNRCLQTYSFFLKCLKKGGKVLVEHQPGTIRQICFTSLTQHMLISDTDLIKFAVKLTQKQINFLITTASSERISVTEVLIRSINTEAFFLEQESKGRKILIEYQSGKIRHIFRAETPIYKKIMRSLISLIAGNPGAKK